MGARKPPHDVKIQSCCNISLKSIANALNSRKTMRRELNRNEIINAVQETINPSGT